MINQRIYAAAELAALALLFAASFWGQIHVGVVGWVIVAAWLFVLTLPISALFRKHKWKESGFRLDNFVSGLVFVAASLSYPSRCYSVSQRLLECLSRDLLRPAHFDRSPGGWSGSAAAGIFFQRWRALLQNSWLAAAANSLVFGLFHAPEIALVAVASLGSFFFNWLFLRNPNVFLIGIAHGVLSIVALPLMIGTGVMAPGRIGPPELAR